MAQNFARFGHGSTRGHLQAWHYYLTRIWGDLGLWSVLLPGALGWRYHSCIWADRNRRLFWLWFVTLFVFFSLAATKREVYLLPAYAALAALLGDLVAQALASTGRPEGGEAACLQVLVLGWTSLVVATLAAVAGLAAIPALEALLPRFRRLDPDLHPMVLGLRLALAALACCKGAAAWWLWRQLRAGRAGRIFGGVVAVHAAAWAVAMLMVFPAMDQAKSYRPAAEWLKARVVAGDDLGFHYPGRETTKSCGFLFYGGMRLHILRTPDELAVWLAADGRRVAVVGASAAAALKDDPRFIHREMYRFEVGSTAWVVWDGWPISRSDQGSTPVPTTHRAGGG